MDVRPVAREDSARIEDIARSSFQTSYSLSPTEIDTLVEQFFSAAALEERMEDGSFFVAEVEGDLGGFAEIDDEDTLRWLHVDPAARGQGVGTALFEAVRDELSDRDVPVTARILESASEGSGFLERFGLAQTESVHLEFDEERFPEHVYTTTGEEVEANEPSVEVPPTVDVDGQELLLDRDEEIPGSEAPFYPLYETESDDSRWGFFCSECGSTDVAADGLDRLECSNCGNTHRADQWDEAYL
jgi:GNAT superfamily N-acetyltransferase/ribosomal protein S27AE